jgi:hypothetical protein
MKTEAESLEIIADALLIIATCMQNAQSREIALNSKKIKESRELSRESLKSLKSKTTLNTQV